MMDMESAYGAALRELTRREGHIGLLPPSPPAAREDARLKAILAMRAAGMTRVQIAAALGVVPTRISQIAGRE